MGIEELEKELKDLKAYAYDLNNEYAKFTARIDAVVEEIKKIKGNQQEIEIKNDEVVQIPESEEVAEKNIEPQVVSEETPVVEEVTEPQVVSMEAPVVEETAEPQVVSEETPVVEEVTEPQIVSMDAPVVEEVTEPQVVVTEEAPVQQIIEQNNESQALHQEPLIPAGIEIAANEEKKNEIFINTDVAGTTTKAIMISSAQAEKLRNSKDENKKLVFETNENQVQDAVGAETKEEIKSQIDAMTAELMTTTDEARANELNEGLKILNKKYEVA
ncbi:MAG: hypothetical protein IK137_02850 [Bacilli bacterium]|nr:hypothetical protein [Bacilli bacterium]